MEMDEVIPSSAGAPHRSASRDVKIWDTGAIWRARTRFKSRYLTLP